MRRLEDLEYLALHRGAPGQSFVYALNFEMDERGKPVLPGLSYGAKRSGFLEGVSGSSLGQVWGVSGGGAREESPATTRVDHSNGQNLEKNTSREIKVPASLRNPIVAVAKPNGAEKPNGHGLTKRASGVK